MSSLAWAEEALSKVLIKEKKVVGRNYDKLPYTAVDHVFDVYYQLFDEMDKNGK